jgi:hypothetical protein
MSSFAVLLHRAKVNILPGSARFFRDAKKYYADLSAIASATAEARRAKADISGYTTI